MRLSLWNKWAAIGSLLTLLGICISLYSCGGSQVSHALSEGPQSIAHVVASSGGVITINYQYFPSNQLISASNSLSSSSTNLESLWRNSFSNFGTQITADHYNSYKYIIDQLDPIDVRLLIGAIANFNTTNHLRGGGWGVSDYDVGLSLRNLQRLGLIEMLPKKKPRERDAIDLVFFETNHLTSKEDMYYYRIRFTSIGLNFMRSCMNYRILDENGGEWFLIDWE